MSKKTKTKEIKNRSMPALGLLLKTGGHSGPHKNAPLRDKKTPRKAKHKKSLPEY